MITNTSLINEHLDKFYEKPFAFSYSGINKLLFSPSLFYSHYILNEREDSVDSHLVAGRVIHCLLLEPQNFEKEFLIIPTSLPTGNNRNVVDYIFKVYTSSYGGDLNLEDFKDEIIIYLEEINLHQSLKTDEQRLKKILSDQNNSYFQFLKEKKNKTLIDNDILIQAKSSVETLKNDSEICELLQLESHRNSSLKSYNEKYYKMDLKDYPFDLKGVVDNIVVDEQKKTVFINDLKTTGKPLVDFSDSVEYFKYWIQAVIYTKLVKHNLNIDDTWNTVFTFVVIDKYNMYYPFQVSEASMRRWQQGFKSILEVCKYHYVNKDYKLPYALANREVTL